MRALLGLLAALAAVVAAGVWTVLDAEPAAPTMPNGDDPPLGDADAPHEVGGMGFQAEPILPPPPPPPSPEPVPEPTSTQPTTPAPDPFAAAKAEARAKHCVHPGWPCRTFEWAFRDGAYWLVLELDADLYAAVRSEEKPFRVRSEGPAYVREPAYDLYVSDARDDRFVEFLARELDRMADAAGIAAEDRLAFVLAFVQGLRYTADAVSTGFDEYPRFPVETLVDEGGDCEDTAILFASLVLALGRPAVLLSPPGHMAVGIQGSMGDGSGLDIGSVRYLYAETTGQGWGIGETPPEFANASLDWWTLAPAPLFAFETTSVFRDGYDYRVTTQVSNQGTGTAEGAVVAELREGEKVLASDSCGVFALAPGAWASCNLQIPASQVPPGRQARLEVRVEGGGRISEVLATNLFTT